MSVSLVLVNLPPAAQHALTGIGIPVTNGECRLTDADRDSAVAELQRVTGWNIFDQGPAYVDPNTMIY
jgi:hypothetical protein